MGTILSSLWSLFCLGWVGAMQKLHCGTKHFWHLILGLKNANFLLWQMCKSRFTSPLPAGSSTLQHSLEEELGNTCQTFWRILKCKEWLSDVTTLVKPFGGFLISSGRKNCDGYLRSVAGSQPVIIPFIKLRKRTKNRQNDMCHWISKKDVWGCEYELWVCGIAVV